MPRYKLTIAYEGTDFCGWQRQEPPELSAEPPPGPQTAGVDEQNQPREGPTPSSPPKPAYSADTPLMPSVREGRVALRTVQGVLEQTINAVVREPVELIGASRTDSGVHAKGQVCAFTCSPRVDERGRPIEEEARGRGWPASRGADRLAQAINTRLPDDVRVVDAELTSIDFDPIGDVIDKAYSYTFARSHIRPLWDRRVVYHVPRREPLDVPLMRAAAELLVGTHDFAGFAAAGHGRQSTIRTVLACAVTPIGPALEREERVRMDIVGTGFLWNMVRIIAGTVLDVGQRRRTLDDVRAALATGDRTRAGPTLRPEGLCLEWIRYKPSASQAIGPVGPPDPNATPDPK